MPKCPVCGHYLNFQIIYCAGQPVVKYTCACGYDSTKHRTTYTTNTTTETKPRPVSNFTT